MPLKNKISLSPHWACTVHACQWGTLSSFFFKLAAPMHVLCFKVARSPFKQKYGAQPFSSSVFDGPIPLHFASHWSACQNFIRIQFEYMRYYTTCLPLLYNSHIHHSFCYPFLGSTQATYIVSVFYLSTFLHLLKPQHQVLRQPIL